MTAKTIPVAGEPFLGDDPAVMKVLKITFGDSDQDVNFNDGDSTQGLGRALCSLPYGIHVYDVGWRVITAFTAAVDLTIGVDCGSDCVFFALDSDIACTVAEPNLVTAKSFALGKGVDSFPLNLGTAQSYGGVEGFTPDSDGNNLVIHCWPADTDWDEAGNLEVYVYYHAAVTV